MSIDPFVRGDNKGILIFGLVATIFAIVFVIFAVLPDLPRLLR
jgi:hypothetical protein